MQGYVILLYNDKKYKYSKSEENNLYNLVKYKEPDISNIYKTEYNKALEIFKARLDINVHKHRSRYFVKAIDLFSKTNVLFMKQIERFLTEANMIYKLSPFPNVIQDFYSLLKSTEFFSIYNDVYNDIIVVNLDTVMVGLSIPVMIEWVGWKDLYIDKFFEYKT